MTARWAGVHIDPATWLQPILATVGRLVWTGEPARGYDRFGKDLPQAQTKSAGERDGFPMTITKPFEVVGRHCQQTSCLGGYAKITVRVEPAETTEFVNEANVAGFEARFAEGAFDGIRSVSHKYSWLAFRFTITDATVHPVDASKRAFHLAGVAAAKEVFRRIYKRLTITANHPETKVYIADTEGSLVQQEVGRVETSLLQGDYDVYFGNARAPVRVHLLEDTVLQEGPP